MVTFDFRKCKTKEDVEKVFNENKKPLDVFNEAVSKQREK